MADLTILQWTPLASALIWFSLVVYQLARDRFHTWSEIFLLCTFFLVGAYALSEVFLFNASTDAGGEEAAMAAITCIVLAAEFLLLYGLVLYGRMRRALLWTLVPTGLVLGLVWTVLVDRVVLRAPDGAVYVVYYDPTWLPVWAAYLILYPLVGVIAFYATYREIRKQTPRLAKRMRALLVAILLAFLLGAGTDLLLPLLGIHTPPLFSTILVLPGAIALFALSPLGELGIPAAIRRWKAHGYDLKAVFLMYKDSTLIGAKVRPEERAIDEDLLTSTLGVIQNFMRTSFPSLRGGFLRTIAVGGNSLVIERGRHTYLVLVIEGRESDPLRRQMRDALLEYEERNRDALARWRGAPADASGTEELLSSFYRGEEFGAGPGPS